MSQFKTVEEAAHFINTQKTRDYKLKVFASIRETHGEKFANALRQKLKKEKA